MSNAFPSTPSITLFDPLAEFLGAGDGRFHYGFEDAVKLAGHACPTVAGAFLMAVRGLKALYGDETPTRGGIRVTIPGPPDQGVNGPISQVLTLITGAAADNGFQGLAGRHSRQGLMSFAVAPAGGITFERIDNGARVTLRYDPSAIPPAPAMIPLLQRIQQGERDPEVHQRFRGLWRARVVAILEDGGEATIRLE